MTMTPHISGLICTLPRSGSWLLAEYLYETGLVGTPEEYFRPDYLDWYRAQWNGQATSSIEDYIGLCRRNTTADTGIFTAKLHWYQMEWLLGALGRPTDSFRELFEEVRYVHLVRRDLARQALSWYRAIRSNAWFDVGEPAPRFDGALDLQQVRWLEDTLTDHARRWDEYFRLVGAAPLVVDFRDVVDRPVDTVRAVLRHFGVAGSDEVEVRGGRMVRQSDDWTDFWEHAYQQVRDGLPHRDKDVQWAQRLNRFIRVSA